MATYTQALRERGEIGLATLLTLRPDLATPPPATLRSLAARSSTRASLDRALGELDALSLQLVEAALALHHPGSTASPARAADPGTLARAVGLTEAEAGPALARAADLALLWQDGETPGHHPAPGLAEALGPFPAGLGPWLSTTLARRSEDGLARLASALDLPTTSLDGLVEHVGDAATVTALLAGGPPGVRQVLDALTWGPPVGRSPEPASAGVTSAARAAVEWLLRHGLLSIQDPQHVVLPREVALVLREGRTHRSPATAPEPAGTPIDPRTVDAESAQHAEEAVRLVAGLVTLWGEEPATVLRSGGLGTRELRRVASRLDVDDTTAALVVEVAGSTGLVVEDGEEPPSLAPTAAGEEWLREPVPQRWQEVAEGWLTAERAAWLVGTRDEKGARRAALDPESRRPWAPRLRTTALEVVAQHPGAALSAAQVHQVLAWRAPRSAPPEHAVEAVLAEATTLGVLGAGALSPAGRALLGLGSQTDDAAARGAAPQVPATHEPTASAPAEALAAQLPPAVEEVLLQGDLTGIVPGRPSPSLGALLDLAAQVESRGAGLTVRFTPDSVRRALDAGRTAEELLAELSRHARAGVPQPLEYLVLDAARRHGQVRVGMASSYLRSDDPGLLAGLVEDRSLAGLGLLRLAPTVIAAQATPAALVSALRARGLAPVTEDQSGAVLVAGPRRHVVRGVRGRGRVPAARSGAAAERGATTAEEARERRLRRLVDDLLRGAAREEADGAGVEGAGLLGGPDAEGTPDPVIALALLREAATEGREVWLELVGPGGTIQRRRVRPVRVDGGRVRAVDAEREAELTVAVHRIATVTPA
ncbi:helicase-associated domain-containing protein [Actinotalea sp. BY-33]|uniref:Helicase-associated domain-containing protein n=1 Tax=Actinotalea soli TaxID=2819234 RepID=A0A939LVT9_9CELL|nr:helicase-associated domain-containing protein [Actinotalea soli]MBO1752207.1 helicase-associated domain-containing protein [Actinotalea soli]